MGLIHIDLFTTLDDVIDEQIGAGMQGLDALLLGRRTFDILAAFWPEQDPDAEGVAM